MGVFRQFPYSNFHEMNMDEIIKIVKTLAEEWAEYQLKWDNLYDDTTKALADFKEFVYSYFDNLDVQDEINIKLNQMLNAGQFDPIILEELSPVVSDWLENNIHVTEGVVIDSTLSIEGAAADAKATGDAIKNVLSNLAHNNIFNPPMNKNTVTLHGVTFSYNEADDNYSVIGVSPSSEPVSYKLITENPVNNFKVGNAYHFNFECDNSNIYIQVYYYAGSTLTLIRNIYSNAGDVLIALPTDATGILIRARVNNSQAYNDTFKLSVMGNATADDIKTVEEKINDTIIFKAILTTVDDIDNIQSNGSYLWLGDNRPNNSPDNSTSIMIVEHAFDHPGFVLQTVHTVDGKMFQRIHGSESFGWYSWAEISAGSGGTGTVENIYNITTNPTINTDTNGWLQAIDTDTTDETNKTDMTGAIMSMLTDTGYCHLGEGIFYVSGNIDMPSGSIIEGCGKKTVVRLLQNSSANYIIKMREYNTVSNISFEGGKTLTVPTIKGNRNGVAFMANYNSEPSVQSTHCMMNNVWFANFSGAGIYCHNTSINYAKGIYVNNAYIYNSYAGIDINYYSEFNKFVNICTAWCRYGCINNSGNNVFDNCTFHAIDTGFLIDGTQPNSGHGTISNCTFCHIGNNTGSAIRINSLTNGFVIANCQFWYNSIDISNSSGIVFTSCEMGNGINGGGATIIINGGDTVMFTGCVFMRDVTMTPDIQIRNNNKVKFNNCYGSISGNEITR